MIEKKIYIINQYYEPFFAATGQLLKELSEYLVKNGFEIEIITGKNGNNKLPKKEIINNVKINRIKNSKDGTKAIKKLFSYLTFYWNLLWFLFFKVEKKAKILSLSTPPLLTYIPVFVKTFKKYQIYYNIQDLYPDILVALSPEKDKSFFYKILKKISQKILDKSDELIVIGDVMKKLLMKNYDVSSEKISIIENWSLKEIEEFKENYTSTENELTVVYSGNMGRAHEYYTLLDTFELIYKNNIKNINFIISGGGFNYNKLKVKSKKYQFVIFQNYVEKNELPKLLKRSDICLVIGKKELNGIIIPSKFYGIIAAYKPIIYINDGVDDISKHIEYGKLGFKVNNFDSEKLFSILLELSNNKKILNELSNNVEQYYNKNLRRIKSLEKYKEILEKGVMRNEKSLNNRNNRTRWKLFSRIFNK